MFDIRSNEEADGDSKMIGSERLDETADAIGFGGMGALRFGNGADDLFGGATAFPWS